MLHFTNSTAYLPRTSSNGKLFGENKLLNKKLPKSQSFANLEEKNHQKIKRSQTLMFKSSKKSLKSRVHKKVDNLSNWSKKPFENIENVNLSSFHPDKSKNQKTDPEFKFNSKQISENNFYQTFGTGFAQKPKQKQVKEKYQVKKRIFRNTNKLQNKQNSLFSKKSNSFLKRSLIPSKVCIGSNNKLQWLQKEELYYIDELKKELNKIQQYQDQNAIPPMIIGHFFQSISTFYRFKNVRKPDDSHLSVFLPNQKRNKATLIFDMDQTLIHAEPYRQQAHSTAWGQNFQISIQDGTNVMINLKIRPFAIDVLKRLKNKFQIGIFTAAHQSYAKQILNKIDPQHCIFDFFLFRQHCHVIDGKLAIKDLKILSNRSIKNLILIDNSPHTYLYQPQNAVPIFSFYHDQNDRQILKLEAFLNSQKLFKKQDVRQILKRKFQFHRYTQFKEIDQLVEQLYGPIK